MSARLIGARESVQLDLQCQVLTVQSHRVGRAAVTRESAQPIYETNEQVVERELERSEEELGHGLPVSLTRGTYSTWADSGLPKQISSIGSVQTSFSWSGNSGGDFNAAYDVWFSSSQPTAGTYDDAISGFLMVWLYKPGSRQPIGGSASRTASVAGQTWDVWVGPRGNTSAGTDDANRPVVSYVAAGSIPSLEFNLKDFIDDAVANASTDQSNGGTSQAFASSWYLTDVFAGFEAWTGSSIVGNSATFTCVVQ